MLTILFFVLYIIHILKEKKQLNIQKMNFRPNNYGNSHYQPSNKMGYSNISKAFGYSNRNAPEDQNVGQLEFMLENQRKKFKDSKEKLEYDLDNERKIRIQFENKLIKIKDQFSRKDVAISELQFKINNILHQNQDIIVQNQHLKHQLARMEQLYRGKIHQLQNQLAMESRNFEETTLQYNNQFEKFKNQGQYYVEQLTFQFQRKIKNLQEKLKSSQAIKRDLAMQNKKLNDILISNKLSFEEQVRDIKNKARDQENKKIQYLTKSFEQKLQIIEESKDLLARKMQDLIRSLQDKERQLSECEAQNSQEINKLRQDNTDFQQQINHLNYLIGKLKSQLSEKDNLIGRSLNDNDAQLNSLRQQLENKKIQSSQLQASIRELRLSFKEAQGQWERRRRQLSERASIMQAEARKYKDQYLHICDVLKSKINSTIDNVSFKK